MLAALPWSVDVTRGEGYKRGASQLDRSSLRLLPERQGIPMEELIARVASAANIAPDRAQRAIELMLAFLKKEGPTEEVADMLRAVPGGPEAAAAGETCSPKSSGLMGGLLSLMGGSGGLMGLAGQLTGIGLGTGEMATVGRELFAYAKEKAGEERVGRVAASIPGLAQLI